MHFSNPSGGECEICAKLKLNFNFVNYVFFQHKCEILRLIYLQELGYTGLVIKKSHPVDGSLISEEEGWTCSLLQILI